MAVKRQGVSVALRRLPLPLRPCSTIRGGKPCAAERETQAKLLCQRGLQGRLVVVMITRAVGGFGHPRQHNLQRSWVDAYRHVCGTGSLQHLR